MGGWGWDERGANNKGITKIKGRLPVRDRDQTPGTRLERCKLTRTMKIQTRPRCGNRASVEKRVCLGDFTRVLKEKRVSEEIDRLGHGPYSH